jgi:hypothetical protein
LFTNIQNGINKIEDFFEQKFRVFSNTFHPLILYPLVSVSGFILDQCITGLLTKLYQKCGLNLTSYVTELYTEQNSVSDTICCLIGPLIEEAMYSFCYTTTGLSSPVKTFLNIISLSMTVIASLSGNITFKPLLCINSLTTLGFVPKESPVLSLLKAVSGILFGLAHVPFEVSDQPIVHSLAFASYFLPFYLFNLRLSSLFTKYCGNYYGFFFTPFNHIFNNTCITLLDR